MRFLTLKSGAAKKITPRNQQAFSLIEMLVVVAIVSILTALTMSSFSSLRTMALTSSGNQIVDTFSMARQNSLSKNAYTAVVIKSQGKGAYTSYCLLELIRGDDGSLGQWKALTSWRSLGQGVVFESERSEDTYAHFPVSLPKALPTSFPFQGQAIDLTASAIYQCYQPDGTLLSNQPNPPNRMLLRLIQGKVDSSSGQYTYQGSITAGQQVSYYDLVFVGNTGVTKIERP